MAYSRCLDFVGTAVSRTLPFGPDTYRLEPFLWMSVVFGCFLGSQRRERVLWGSSNAPNKSDKWKEPAKHCYTIKGYVAKLRVCTGLSPPLGISTLFKLYDPTPKAHLSPHESDRVHAWRFQDRREDHNAMAVRAYASETLERRSCSPQPDRAACTPKT